MRLFAKKAFPVLLIGQAARMDHGGWSSVVSLVVFAAGYLLLDRWFFDPEYYAKKATS